MDMFEIQFMLNGICVKELYTDILSALHYALVTDFDFDTIYVENENYTTKEELFNKFIELNNFCNKVYGVHYDI